MLSNTYYAEDLVHWPKKKMWDLAINDDSDIWIQFDNGYEIRTDWRQTLFSWYHWEFHRRYPELPIYETHHIDNVALSDSTSIKILENLGALMRRIYPEVDFEEVMKLSYIIENDIMREFAMNSVVERFVRTYDHQTLVRIHNDPDIRAALSELKADRHSVKKVYAKIHHILLTKAELSGDETADAIRAGELRLGQLLQIIALRGYTSGIDQRIHDNMVCHGFSVGIHRLSHFAQVSRDASKAQQATDNPVKKTEYYNREVQLITYAVRKIRIGDCGSKTTIPWHVTASDLENVITGRYYYSTDGVLKEIGKEDRHLIGHTIQMRTGAYCQEKEDGVYCSHCIGSLGEQVFKNSNAGYTFTVAKNQVITQDVISTKHMLLSAISEMFIIDEYHRRFIYIMEDDLNIYLSPDMKDCKFKISIDQADIFGLAYLNSYNDEEDKLIESAELNKISILDQCVFFIEDHDHRGNYQPFNVPLKRGSYKPSLSHQMLRYIRDNGYSHSENGRDIIVDMNRYDQDNPIFVLPNRHGSTLDLMEEIKKNIFGTDPSVNYRYRADYDDPAMMTELLNNVADLTNRKFKVNLSIIDVVCIAMMGRDPKNGDYRPPKLHTGKHMVKYSQLIAGRSLSGKAAHERQYEMVESPSSYIYKVRPNHPFDVLVDPINVMPTIKASFKIK